MKNTDISKVKVGDLWVRGNTPALVVKVNKKTLDLYLPEGTKEAERYTRALKVLDGSRIRVWFELLEDEMRDNGYYFDDGEVK